ncbi:hypothetical protein Zmor_014747 [Zophobas morio]|uniref:Uncharacterized protein n=1 Tax=Zophobas morio TaxID=2755281 RepID=A0AA38MFU9_9CUCU|nr:hypothetical protein Zmor_014747 [Zophobas morio]
MLAEMGATMEIWTKNGRKKQRNGRKNGRKKQRNERKNGRKKQRKGRMNPRNKEMKEEMDARMEKINESGKYGKYCRTKYDVNGKQHGRSNGNYRRSNGEQIEEI